jgi:hypothetical protein
MMSMQRPSVKDSKESQKSNLGLEKSKNRTSQRSTKNLEKSTKDLRDKKMKASFAEASTVLKKLSLPATSPSIQTPNFERPKSLSP